MANITDERSYEDELLYWGRNGSFYPSFVPSQSSIDQLAIVQRSIVVTDPKAKPTTGLHATFFYCKPRRVFEYIRGAVNPDVVEPILYIDLKNAFSTIAFLKALPNDSRRIRVQANSRLQPFGAGTTAALELLPATDLFASLKALIRRGLGYHGVSGDALVEMAEVPEFGWFVGDSKPHISLASSADLALLGGIALPDTVEFDAVSYGSSPAPDGVDPLRWMVMGS